MINNTPCKDCEARFVGCHSYCDDYREWKKIIDYERKQRKKEREAEGIYIDTIHKAYEKNKRR